MRAFLRAATALSLLALCACAGGGASPDGRGTGAGGSSGGGSGGGGATRDGLDGRTFVSTSVTEAGKGRPLVAGTRITIRFGGGRVQADAGCNLMSGPVRFDGGRLVVGDLAMTEMGCAPELHAQDQWLSRLLRASPTWRFTGNQLTLIDSGTEVRMDDRVVTDPDRPLAGTPWEVDTIIDKGAARSVPAGTTAFLVFAADGGVTGSTGCNNFSTRAKVADNKITFAGMITTKMACEDAANALDRAVLRVLQQNPVTYRNEARHLTMTAPDGGGLRLVAA
jgi:heat shock protein HslJ